MRKILVVSLSLLFVAGLAWAVCYLDFLDESLPGAFVNQAYSHQLQACCGTTPYTFSVYSGSFPAGISMSSGGLISGTPTSTGYTTVYIRLTDSASPTPCTLVRAYELYVF
jgi:hypothetical protein